MIFTGDAAAPALFDASPDAAADVSAASVADPVTVVADPAPSLPDAPPYAAPVVDVELTNEQVQFIVDLAFNNGATINGASIINEEYVRNELFEVQDEDLKKNLQTYFSDIKKDFEFGEFKKTPMGNIIPRFQTQFKDTLREFILPLQQR